MIHTPTRTANPAQTRSESPSHPVMSDREQSDVEDLLHRLWPTADPARCASTAEHLKHFPFEGVMEIVQSYHGQSSLMPEVEIIQETKLRYPEIAQRVAASKRRAQLGSETAAARTARLLAEYRQAEAVAQRDEAEVRQAVAKLSDDDLAQHLEAALAKLTPGMADRYRKCNPRQDLPLMRLICVEARAAETATPAGAPDGSGAA